YINNDSLGEELLSRVTTNTQSKVDWLESEIGAKLIYILIPNTNEIYPEYMPDSIIQGSVSLREEVAGAFEAGGAYVIDMYDTLISHKDDQLPIFHKTDSHWSEYGAYFAYQALFSYISGEFPDASPRDISDFNFSLEQRYAGDLYYDTGLDITQLTVESTFSDIKFNTPVYLDKYASALETRINEATMGSLSFSNTAALELPDVYIMRDSYSVMMFDWIAERCGESYFKPLWEFSFNTDEILSYSPDYVIYIISDMNILSILR
ncbi:MAG TPA: DHHW family protein, partial [Bacillota bacterium]|nr:DHHW family protein [Bacillota bacterium]